MRSSLVHDKYNLDSFAVKILHSLFEKNLTLCSKIQNQFCEGGFRTDTLRYCEKSEPYTLILSVGDIV